MTRRLLARNLALVAAVAVSVSTAPAFGHQPTSDQGGELSRFDRRVLLAQQEGDPGPLAAVFMEHGTLLLAGVPEIQGRPEIERKLAQLFREVSVRPVANEVGGMMRSSNSTVVWDAGAGLGLPAGDLADLVDPGLVTGLGVSYRVHPRVALRIGGDVEFLPGGDDLFTGIPASDLTLWHYNAGAAIELLPPGPNPWSLTAELGVGASTFDFEESETTETYLTTNGGLRMGYAVSPMLDLYLGGDGYLMFTEEEELGFDTGWSFPVSAGLRVRIP